MKYLILNNIRFYGIRILIVAFNLCLLLMAFYLTNSQIKIGGHSIYTLLYPYDRRIEWWFYLLIFFLLISVLNVIVLFVLSILISNSNERFSRIRKEYESELTDIILGYIYSGRSGENEPDEGYLRMFRKTLDNRRKLEVFFSVMIRIQDMVDEDLSSRYRSLIDRLNLNEKILWFLYSCRLSEKIIAMKMISRVKKKGHENTIQRYSRSRNYVLRIAALESLIRLSESDHLDILLSHKEHISRLDINIIINEVEKDRKEDINYRGLLGSPSPGIAATGLLLTKIRNRREYMEEARRLLSSEDEFLHMTAWEVFMHFAHTSEDLIFIIDEFGKESFAVRLLIIKALRSFTPDDRLLRFLDKAIREEDLLIKLEALKALFESNLERFLSYAGTDNKMIRSAYNEIVDLNLA